MKDISADWEEGDELEHEYERSQRIAKEKAKQASKIMPSGKPKDVKKSVHKLVECFFLYVQTLLYSLCLLFVSFFFCTG